MNNVVNAKQRQELQAVLKLFGYNYSLVLLAFRKLSNYQGRTSIIEECLTNPTFEKIDTKKENYSTIKQHINFLLLLKTYNFNFDRWLNDNYLEDEVTEKIFLSSND